MSGQEYIKSLIKEAELYQSQGLLAQSKDTYLKVLAFVKKSPNFRNHKKLEGAIADRIRGLEEGLVGVNRPALVPDLDPEVQNLIKNLFSFSEDQNTAAMEGAMALARFGQYERALEEFRKLLKRGILPLAAAKNILRCHLALSSPNDAIDQYERWVSGNQLSKQQLEKIRDFLQGLLERKGIKASLPAVDEPGPPEALNRGKEGDVLDISSVGIRLSEGPRKGKMVEFDVTFQSGDVISVVVSADEKELLEALKENVVLPDMQFYSPIAIFKGRGVVSGKTKIRSGPKQGDYMLDIKIESG
ncbi:MAG: tetratricopeptide repeat protein [Deltaproteobacteria bacterium]|nr:tetratricopeptide repeat protein [Deltaproteobacteria bacterium]